MENMNLIFPVLLVVIFYLFLIRPQMREKKRFEAMLAAMKKGDKVITNSGIYGEIYALKDDKTVTLKIADNVRVDFLKSSISRILTADNK